VLQTDDEHPVDAVIDRIPTIARLDRKLVRLSKQVQEQSGDVEAYLSFEDLRLEQRCTREEAFFDAGHAQGRVAGIIETPTASTRFNPKAGAFSRQLRSARLTSGLSVEQFLAVLLEYARGLLLAEHLPEGQR
jgi:hypothetical protein